MENGIEPEVSFTLSFEDTVNWRAVSQFVKKVFLATDCRALGFHLDKEAWNQRMLFGTFRWTSRSQKRAT
jgi:hypothetical protein